ncbi:PLDc N-terminal domain-containing protein [Thermomonospora umbrina]|uniref:Phospholipase D-like protein n=1 Tax=Thermomonospora umbrina TaxID=111806 RepID=A0A3D9SPZ1_9ACTN|nr:PLDc N-terminal domain-containing protein [Thermomonospora umbrina]REE98022.1 phospholipase D-like protein [Thermomonospora umbrina]
MLYVLLGLITVGIWLFCLFDVLTTDEGGTRLLPKFGWFLIVLLGFMIGSALWLLVGRPRVPTGPSGTPGGPSPTSPGPRPAPPRGPDDDPDFLRGLERRIRGDE